MSKNDKINIAIILAVNLILMIASLFLFPIGDDWAYSTSPRIGKEFVMSTRAIDNLYGIFLGKAPKLFPYLNHIIVVISHCISSVFFYLFSKKILAISKKVSLIFSLLFAISSGCCATVFSVDALNQSLSLAFGVTGIFLYLYCSKPIPKVLVYLFFSALSMFSKESGIFFLLTIPLFELINKPLKKIWKIVAVDYLCGALFSVYYITLVDFSGSAVFGLNIIKNTVVHLAFSVLQMDTVSFFGYGKYVVPGITLLLSLPLIIAIAVLFIKRLLKKDLVALLMLFFWVFSTFPQNTLAGAQEMNSYPTIFFAMLFFAYMCKDVDMKKIYTICIPYIIAAVVSSGIKYNAMYNLSSTGKKTLYNIQQQTVGVEPEKVLVYPLNILNEHSYGVFILSNSGTIGNGYALGAIYGYDTKIKLESYHNVTDKLVTSSAKSTFIDADDEELREILEKKGKEEIKKNQYDLCLIIYPDGSFIQIKE